MVSAALYSTKSPLISFSPQRQRLYERSSAQQCILSLLSFFHLEDLSFSVIVLDIVRTVREIPAISVETVCSEPIRRVAGLFHNLVGADSDSQNQSNKLKFSRINLPTFNSCFEAE